ncbi:S24 family peptidase [Candidatus Thiothrix sp. Deng01]|uniref:S24 family peptidase n=1 Tax=Candidatus Thiothrix phosphatis TaxID=3112415 RepID=A0ABU6CT59_9GAMM|nr:S24 family peptidase [Candidatus Thiothrix sp. Deng01]MEB4589993.1 S24 family peptidase [Candidatus Thiothrix sp. Deng01]
METLKDRLQTRLDEMKLNFSDLARELGLDRQSIYGWTRRDKVPNKYLFVAAKFLACDPQWLQHGEYGRPGAVNVSPGQVVIPIFKQGDYRDMTEGDRLKHESLLCRGEWLAEIFGVNPERGDYEIYRMESTEMQPTINRGDLVVIDRAGRTHVNGLYGIEGKGGALSIARVQYEPDGDSVHITYDNDRFQAMKMKTSKLELAGRVVYVWQGRRDL